MTNVHYENLGRVCHGGVSLSPSDQMYQCLQGYGPIQTYVHKALRGLEDRILEIDWEETTPPPPESSTGRLPPRKRLEQELAKLKPRPPEWFWVRLKPPETDEGDEILREFLGRSSSMMSRVVVSGTAQSTE